jgi:hypothetical protein
MPINYSADQFSNALQGTVDNGFEFFTTPMYVNCPDIGLVGEETNLLKLDSFETAILLGNLTSFFTLIGTSSNLIFQADQTILFVAAPSNTTIGETTTTIMGGYEYDLDAKDIPDDTTEIDVMYDGVSIRTVMVDMTMTNDNTVDGNGGGGGGGDDSSSSSSASSSIMVLRFVPGFIGLELVVLIFVVVVVSMTTTIIV